jgi:hypothetical protein
MKKNLSLLMLAIIAIEMFTGCAGNDSTYRNLKSSLAPAPGKGLVLVYFQSGMLGAATKWHIYMNNNQLLTDQMRRGVFYSIQADPGVLSLSTKANISWWPGVALAQAAFGVPKNQIALQIEPNKTYYLDFHFSEMKQVSQDVGENNIRNCEWLNSPSH